MTKLDVNVGEDFPVDEENRPAPEEDAPHGCGHGGGREAWHRMRAQWLARHRAFHDRLHNGDADVMDVLRDRRVHHLVLGALVLIGLAALFSHRHHD